MIALKVLVRSFAVSLIFALPLVADDAGSSQWGHWRGPLGNGVAPKASPPVTWSSSEGVKWKVEVPGSGTASPIVWGKRVFVVTAIEAKAAAEKKPVAEAPAAEPAEPESGRRRRRPRGTSGGGGGGGGEALPEKRFVLMCLDRATGKTLWEKTAASTAPHQGHHRDHGFASASPMTDGSHVWAYFGSRGLFCYTVEGEPVWERTDFGKMDTRRGFGEGSSPTLHGDMIIVPWDHEGPSYVEALDKKTGKTVWKTERDEPTSWATPLVVEHADGAQVVVSGENFARGYALKTGKEIWRCTGQTGRPVSSPVAADGMVWVGSGFRGSFLGAFKLGAKGDLEGTDSVVWSLERNTPDVPSLLLSGGRLYFGSRNDASLSCVDAKTGEVHYDRERIGDLRGMYASPVAAGGRVYVTGRGGKIAVLEDSAELKVLSTNDMGEPIDATPAIVGNQIFVRGHRHLFCVGK